MNHIYANEFSRMRKRAEQAEALADRLAEALRIVLDNPNVETRAYEANALAAYDEARRGGQQHEGQPFMSMETGFMKSPRRSDRPGAPDGT